MGRIISLQKRLPTHFVLSEWFSLCQLQMICFSPLLQVNTAKVQALTAESAKNNAKAALPLHINK